MDTKDNFETSVRKGLREMGFTTVGYYSYPTRVDIVGYLDPPVPLKLPFKFVASLFKGQTTLEQIQNSAKLAEDSQANRLLVFTQTKKSDLPDSVLKFIDSIGAEIFDVRDVLQLTPGTTSTEQITELEKLSTSQLIKYLPEFSRQKIPYEIRAATNDKVHAWQLFEQAVFSIFNYAFVNRTRVLGSKALFKNEPEGEVVTHQLKGLIYECKSSQDSYTMSSEDKAIYQSYIQNKEPKFYNYYNTHLNYFVIISPKFAGDVALRRNQIHDKTNVLVVFLESELLKILALWASKMDNNLKHLVDLGKIFKLDEPIVESATVQKYIDEFDSEYRVRY